MLLVWDGYLLVWNGVLSSIHGMEVLLEGDLCLFANLVPGLGVWHHLNHPTLQGEGRGRGSGVPAGLMEDSDPTH